MSTRFSFYSSQRSELGPAMVIDPTEHLGVKMIAPADDICLLFG